MKRMINYEEYEKLKQELEALKPSEWETLIDPANRDTRLYIRVVGDVVEVYFNVLYSDTEITIPEKYRPKVMGYAGVYSIEDDKAGSISFTTTGDIVFSYGITALEFLFLSYYMGDLPND